MLCAHDGTTGPDPCPTRPHRKGRTIAASHDLGLGANLPIASITSRLTAAGIDLALFVGAFFATGLVTVFVAAALDDKLAWVWPIQLAALAVGGIANLAVLQGHNGASIGKSAAGVAVVDDADGGAVGILRALARLVIHVYIDPIAAIGPVLMVVDPAERRTVADRVCRTVVISTR